MNENNETKKDEKTGWKKFLSFLYYPAAIIIPLLIGTYVLLFGVVPSASMEPTYRAGSVFIANRLIDEENLSRGDVVFFHHDGGYLVKRVIGLPGDVITFEGCKVHVNGEVLDESEYLDSSVDTVAFEAEYEVPEGSYFMLGDNRGVSADSRFWDYPFVAADDVEAKMLVCVKVPGWNVEE